MKKLNQNTVLKIIIAILIVVVILLGFNCVNNKEDSGLSSDIYKSHYANTDYRDKVTSCIGHKSPDVDTVVSSIVMSNLLNKLGIKSEPRITSEVNPVTKYVLSTFGVEVPKILEDASDQQLWIVDHSLYAQGVNGIENARIVGITDHHSLGDITTADVVNVNAARANACATLIYKKYKECGIEIDKQMASLMLAAIIDDSYFLKNDMSELDKAAYEDLLQISGIENVDELINNMKDVTCNHNGLSDSEIYHLDYKDYDTNYYYYGIGTTSVRNESDIEPMINRISKYLENEIKESDKDILVFMVNDIDGNAQQVLFVSQDTELVNDLINTAFTNMKELSEIKTDRIINKPSVSRKTVVPYLIEYLNAH